MTAASSRAPLRHATTWHVALHAGLHGRACDRNPGLRQLRRPQHCVRAAKVWPLPPRAGGHLCAFSPGRGGLAGHACRLRRHSAGAGERGQGGGRRAAPAPAPVQHLRARATRLSRWGRPPARLATQGGWLSLCACSCSTTGGGVGVWGLCGWVGGWGLGGSEWGWGWGGVIALLELLRRAGMPAPGPCRECRRCAVRRWPRLLRLQPRLGLPCMRAGGACLVVRRAGCEAARLELRLPYHPPSILRPHAHTHVYDTKPAPARAPPQACPHPHHTPYTNVHHTKPALAQAWSTSPCSRARCCATG